MKRSPLKAKRGTARRNEHRVTHQRIKPKASAPATATERAHLNRVAQHGCLITGAAAEVHHVLAAPDKQRRRDHRWVVPLSPDMHRGRYGVHGLGSEAAFERHHGLASGYLIAWAQQAWSESQ